ncbi:MAG: hypothetical protein R3F43_23260, partial [bacterium]
TRISLLLATGEVAQARDLAQEVADDERAGAVARMRAREWLADLQAAAGEAEPARAAYDALLAQAYDRDQIRRLAVKRLSLAGGPAAAAILRLLTAPPGATLAAADAALDEAVAADPGSPVVQYLVGRRHLRERRFAEGIEALAAALAGGLPHSALRFEAARLIARARFDLGQYAEAGAAFDALAADADPEIERGERFVLRRWARRARFFASAGVDKDPGRPEDAADSGSDEE